jgi:hypothetical protein
MTTEDFNLERVKRLVNGNSILKRVYENTNRRSNRGEASYRAIFNALIVRDKVFMALYQQTI